MATFALGSPHWLYRLARKAYNGDPYPEITGTKYTVDKSNINIIVISYNDTNRRQYFFNDNCLYRHINNEWQNVVPPLMDLYTGPYTSMCALESYAELEGKFAELKNVLNIDPVGTVTFKGDVKVDGKLNVGKTCGAYEQGTNGDTNKCATFKYLTEISNNRTVFDQQVILSNNLVMNNNNISVTLKNDNGKLLIPHEVNILQLNTDTIKSENDIVITAKDVKINYIQSFGNIDLFTSKIEDFTNSTTIPPFSLLSLSNNEQLYKKEVKTDKLTIGDYYIHEVKEGNINNLKVSNINGSSFKLNEN